MARSVRTRVPVDASGAEIPWFTFPAIEFLSQFDFSQKTVFEFGAGNSSLFWSRRAARVVSVEHDGKWFNELRSRLPSAHELYLVENLGEYPQILAQQTTLFDVIVVDGVERRECCNEAISRLSSGGFIILDNSDWHHHCAAALRNSGLLEVDFSGFGPVNAYTWTTSLFFDRAFDFPKISQAQPVHGIGSIHHTEPA